MNPLKNRLIAPAVAAVLSVLSSSLYSRTWTSADGAKSFEGELQSYDAASGKVSVILPNRKRITFNQERLSADDIAWLEKNGSRPAGNTNEVKELPGELPDPDGKEADMNKPVQVYILLGQSNMLGFGKPQVLQGIAAEKYPYLVDDAGAWTIRKDVRNVRVMCSGNSPAKDYTNDWMTIQGNIGPEIGIGHALGHVTDAPVMILKSCIGNRSLGWDLLPPGTEPWEHGGKMQPGYRGTPDDPGGDTEGDMSKGWYAGCQYDGDIAAAKKVLENLDKYYPEAKEYEVAGFFWWQGDKDMRNAAHYESYEKNLIQLIKSLRKDFDAPGARFVSASLGQTKEGSGSGDGVILNAMKAVSKSDDPEFKGQVGFVYSNPLSKGGGSSGHYGGNPETYMNVGEAMGKAMVELLK